MILKKKLKILKGMLCMVNLHYMRAATKLMIIVSSLGQRRGVLCKMYFSPQTRVDFTSFFLRFRKFRHTSSVYVYHYTLGLEPEFFLSNPALLVSDALSGEYQWCSYAVSNCWALFRIPDQLPVHHGYFIRTTVN